MRTSIVVCTYNRAESLRRTLSAIAQQESSPCPIDVIVVDNNSTDYTKDVVASFQHSAAVPVRYVFEPTQGLSHARNRAAAVSTADVLIFIDDDAIPQQRDWAQRLVSAFADRQVAAAGGDATPKWPNGVRPAWLHDNLLGYLGIVQFGHRDVTELHYPYFPFGVNFAVRRRSLIDAGGFSTVLGRSGGTLLSGEETDLCRRIALSGKRVVFVPDAAVFHFMAAHRLDAQWFIARARSQGQSKAAIELTDASVLVASLLFVKRTSILLASYAARAAAATASAPGFAMAAQCKTAMSLAYLRYFLRRPAC